MMDARLDTYDWEEAFKYADPERCIGSKVSEAPFTREDVEEVIALSEGENDEADWLGLFLLKDGRYAFLTAWCDYTGWDCQAGGAAWVSHSLEHLLQMGVPRDARKRLPKAERREGAACRGRKWILT